MLIIREETIVETKLKLLQIATIKYKKENARVYISFICFSSVKRFSSLVFT